MSFTADVKKELTTLEPEKKCCQLAEIALYLRLSGTITLRGGVGIRSTTNNPAVARFYTSLIKEYFGIKTSLEVTEGNSLSKGRSYGLYIGPEMNSDGVLRECGILSVREGSNYFTDSVGSDITRKKCCKKAALKGAFLANGSVNDPLAKGYHLEIACSNETMAEDVRKLMASFGLEGRITHRKERAVVYLKSGEQIVDFLSLIGANASMFKFRDTLVYRNIRNNMMRAQNCDMVNMEKAIKAAEKQIADIQLIEEKRGLDSLPAKLCETAKMRLADPSASLSELAEKFDPPIGKSGLNHRFERLAQIADGLRGLE